MSQENRSEFVANREMGKVVYLNARRYDTGSRRYPELRPVPFLTWVDAMVGLGFTVTTVLGWYWLALMWGD